MPQILSLRRLFSRLLTSDEVDDNFLGVATDFAGATDPAGLPGANVFPYMTWADTANQLLKRRDAAGSAWISLGPLFQPGRYFEANAVPTSNIGDIYVAGVGPCRWSVNGHSRYCRYPSLSNTRVFTTPLGTNIAWNADAWTEVVFVTACAGGGPGGSGSIPAGLPNNSGGGGGGGGAGDGSRMQRVNVVPGRSYYVNVGAGGTPASSTNSYVGVAGQPTFIYDRVTSTDLWRWAGGNPGANSGLGFAGAGGWPNGHGGGTGGVTASYAPLPASNWPPGNGGNGGDSVLGSGGLGGMRSGSTGEAGIEGGQGRGYGAGGGGAGGSLATTAHRFGGAGAPGYLELVW